MLYKVIGSIFLKYLSTSGLKQGKIDINLFLFIYLIQFKVD